MATLQEGRRQSMEENSRVEVEEEVKSMKEDKEMKLWRKNNTVEKKEITNGGER
jgi:hypothetical protein